MAANDAFTAGVRPGGLTDSTEIRLLLCYLVKNAGPITRTEIENALMEEALVNYFEIGSCLDDITQQKLVTLTDGRYTITEKGRKVAQELAYDLPRSLRTDLAQYRELASFAQFGSELDAATQSTLCRGQHMTELLKQNQFAALSVEDQVIAIFAANEGYADDVALSDMPRFEREAVEFVKQAMPELVDIICEGKKIPADMLENLRGTLKRFKESF